MVAAEATIEQQVYEDWHMIYTPCNPTLNSFKYTSASLIYLFNFRTLTIFSL